MTSPFRTDPAFSVGEALRNGFSRRDVDASFLDRPFHGLRAPATPPDSHDGTASWLAARARTIEAARRFSVHMAVHEFFSHTTAALLWDIPLPPLRDEAIHVSVPAPFRAPRGAGVQGHQLTPENVVVARHPEWDLLLTTPACTWALLGMALRDPYDLVAAADGIVRVDRIPGSDGRIGAAAIGSTAELAEAIPKGRRGVRALREALPRVRAGVASRPETWTRLTLVDAGLPEPLTDVDVYDDAGRFIGCVDMAYPRLRIAIEYEGDHHRTDAAQWHRDIEKHERLAQAGWRVIRVSKDALFRHPSVLITAVRSALRERS